MRRVCVAFVTDTVVSPGFPEGGGQQNMPPGSCLSTLFPFGMKSDWCFLDGIHVRNRLGEDTMQENDFHEVVDEFIHLANRLSEEWATPFLSAAFMYAAARYNTFFFYQSDGSPDNRQTAIDYYCEQYRKMLHESMRDHARSDFDQAVADG